MEFGRVFCRINVGVQGYAIGKHDATATYDSTFGPRRIRFRATQMLGLSFLIHFDIWTP
jgi:hypothetical protein